MGCHPTRCLEFAKNETEYFDQLCKLIEANRNKVVAIGECGLDYDRLKFCPANVQRLYFEKQFDLVDKYELPLFLHCRNAFDDFIKILKRNAAKIKKGGVVHSFDGTLEQALAFIDFGFYIGINGCSLKTEEQLKSVAQIPTNRILLETDCPWCAIRPSHAGMYCFWQKKNDPHFSYYKLVSFLLHHQELSIFKLNFHWLKRKKNGLRTH